MACGGGKSAAFGAPTRDRRALEILGNFYRNALIEPQLRALVPVIRTYRCFPENCHSRIPFQSDALSGRECEITRAISESKQTKRQRHGERLFTGLCAQSFAGAAEVEFDGDGLDGEAVGNLLCSQTSSEVGQAVVFTG